MLTQRSEVVNTRSSLAKSSSDLAEGGRGGQQQGELSVVDSCGPAIELAVVSFFHTR